MGNGMITILSWVKYKWNNIMDNGKTMVHMEQAHILFQMVLSILVNLFIVRRMVKEFTTIAMEICIKDILEMDSSMGRVCISIAQVINIKENIIMIISMDKAL